MPRSHATPADLPIRRTQIDANSAPPPVTTAPNSVFHAGAQAKAAARAARAPVERMVADSVVIHQGVPLPPSMRNNVSDGYRALIERMAPGTHVQLPIKQAQALMATAKKVKPDGAVFSFRKLSDIHGGVWRTA